MTEREKIAGRIRALLAKTVSNGCTEGEAIATATKASELLESYNLTLDEVELRASPFGSQDHEYADVYGSRIWKVAKAIAYLTNTKYWSSESGVVPVRSTFFGFVHEVEIAHYLMDICANAMRYETGRYERQFGLLNASAKRRRVTPFVDGMVDRLRERIRALKPKQVTGSGLIVLHDALIEVAMNDEGIKLADKNTRPSRDLEDGYSLGRIAGDRVALNSAITGQAVSGRIADR